jgi:putative membrane protein
MHRTTRFMAMLVSLCVAVSAFAQTGQEPGTGENTNPNSTGARGQGMGREQGRAGDDRAGGMAGDRAAGDRAEQAGSRLNVQIDQQFEQDWIKHAMSGNQFEIQAGQLVGQKAQDPQIKQFAQRLVQDHQKAADQLKQVAQQMNVQVSEDLMPVHQAKLQELQQKPAKQLELAFIFDQVACHTKDLLEYQFVAQNAQNPQLKQFAQQTVPHLRQHLQTAMSIAPVSGGLDARTAGERIPPAGGSDHGATGSGSGHTGGTGGGRSGDR